jgi:hypothetical protein
MAAAGDITLLYSSRDVEHNNAVALREFLMARLELARTRAQVTTEESE